MLLKKLPYSHKIGVSFHFRQSSVEALNDTNSKVECMYPLKPLLKY